MSDKLSGQNAAAETSSQHAPQKILPRPKQSTTDDAEPVVTIPVAQYESLIRDQRDYTNLKKALTSGGVSAEALQLLINSERGSTPVYRVQVSRPLQHSKLSHPWRPLASAPTFVPLSRNGTTSNTPERGRSLVARSLSSVTQTTASTHLSNLPTISDWVPTRRRALSPTTNEDSELAASEVADRERQSIRGHDTSFADRSLLFSGLSPLTTLLDLTNVIRGGAVLTIFMTTNNTVAHVNFVEAMSAHNFHQYCKREGIYVKNKLITVDWSERQTFIPPHLLRQIEYHDASRNLIIRSPTNEISEEIIRQDLEHIHLLEIVDIQAESTRILIFTNSIARAVTARECMMSRLRYKAVKIDFYPDECRQAIPSALARRGDHKPPTAGKHVWSRRGNRFDALDGSQSGESQFGS